MWAQNKCNSLTARSDGCTFNDINNNIIIQGRKQRTNGMYPGITLYANTVKWKNWMCGNQKTLPLALTLWFLTSCSVLMSPLFCFSGTFITSKNTSNQQEWHETWQSLTRPQAWAAGPVLTGLPDSLLALRPCPRAPGVLRQTWIQGLSSALCLSPLLNRVVPGT